MLIGDLRPRQRLSAASSSPPSSSSSSSSSLPSASPESLESQSKGTEPLLSDTPGKGDRLSSSPSTSPSSSVALGMHTGEKDKAKVVADLQFRVNELEGALRTLRAQLDSDMIASPEPTTFKGSLIDRGGWLIGLLMCQSCSSFILQGNQELLEDHPAIIYFLTMLVGAGGNAGNQAAVRVIRRIALGTISSKTAPLYLAKELQMGFALALVLGIAGLARGFMSTSSISEIVAISASCFLIVFISIAFGAVLPLLLYYCKIDPAHSSTTIQVIMDVLGVFITCVVATFLLDSSLGKNIMTTLGISATSEVNVIN